jgi:hypothetical protein
MAFIASALYWASAQVKAQTQSTTASEISQSVDSLNNSNPGSDTKAQLRGTTNADRIAAAKRAAASLTAKASAEVPQTITAEATVISTTQTSNTTVSQTTTTTPSTSAYDAMEGGSK